MIKAHFTFAFAGKYLLSGTFSDSVPRQKRLKKSIIYFGFICLISLTKYSHALDFSLVNTLNKVPELTLTGYVKNETAYRIQEPRSYTKIRNVLNIDANFSLTRKTNIVMKGWAYHDLAYDIFDYDTIAARTRRDIDQPLNFVAALPEDKDSDVIKAKEFYIDYMFDSADLRIGKQLNVWGVMPGIRIVDELNPMDFREFILPDLLDYRIALWTAKLDYYTDYGDLQFIAIPELVFNKPAPPGSEWELMQEVPGTIYPDTRDLRNMELALKYKNSWFNTEVTFNYHYTWDDFPVLFRDVRFGTSANDLSSGLEIESAEFSPRYKRLQMFGTTLRREIFGQIFNIEISYVKDKYFGLTNVDRDGDSRLDNFGVLKRNHVRFGGSIDFNILKTEFSPGITNWYIFNYDEALIQDQLDISLNLYARKILPDSNTVLEMLVIYLHNLQEAYVNPELTLNASDKLAVSIGIDLFYGEKSQTGPISIGGRPDNLQFVTASTQFIGNFDKNDRLYIELKYSF